MNSIRPHCLIALTALIFLGCGLSDYEQAMYEQQLRVENMDRENAVLGPPLTMPPQLSADGKNTGQPVMEFYLRAPLGISPNYDEHPYSEIMWRYGATQGGAGFASMFLGASTELDRDHFWQAALLPFTSVDLAEVKKENKQPIGRPAIEFEKHAFTMENKQQPLSYYIYVYRGELAGGQPARIAIVFCMPQAIATNKEIQDSMDLCLKTLQIGSDAAIARRNYRPPSK